VCSLERNLSTKNHFEQIPDDKKHLMNDIYLAACPVVKPEVYKEWYGKHLVVFRDFAHFKWLGLNKGILNTGKSVTNLAFMVAHFLGCSPIILVGQDLAFAPDGTTHVNGADHARDGLKNSKLILNTAEVMGNNGMMLKSLDTWIGMLKRFEVDIEMFNVDCINATEGGALIKGTKIVTLEETIRKYMTKEYPIKEMLDNNLKSLSSEEIYNDFQIMDKRLMDGKSYLKICLDNIDIMLDSLEEFFGRCVNRQTIDKDTVEALNYVDKIKGEILYPEMCYYTAMHIIQSWTMGYMNKFKGSNFIFDGKEKTYYKLLKSFEFFVGLKILYKKIYEELMVPYEKERGSLSKLWE